MNVFLFLVQVSSTGKIIVLFTYIIEQQLWPHGVCCEVLRDVVTAQMATYYIFLKSYHPNVPQCWLRICLCAFTVPLIYNILFLFKHYLGYQKTKIYPICDDKHWRYGLLDSYVGTVIKAWLTLKGLGGEQQFRAQGDHTSGRYNLRFYNMRTFQIEDKLNDFCTVTLLCCPQNVLFFFSFLGQNFRQAS